MPKPLPQSRPYAPRGAAAELLYCRAPEILLVGPAGTGKTRAALEKVYICAEKYARMRALLVRKTRVSMGQSVLVTWEEKVVPRRHGILSRAARSHRQSYKFPNGSEVVLGGMDNSDRIMSTEFDLVVAFEATELSQEDWEKLLSRLRNGVMPFQQAIADCNPAVPWHWLRQRAAAGAMTTLISRHEDNPQLFDAATKTWTPAGETYRAMLDRLTGTRRQRLLLGQWAAAEGLVYPQFADCILPGSPERLPSPAARAAGAIDWGWTDPTAVLAAALAQDGCIYIVEEIHETHLGITDLARRLAAMQRKWSLETFFADASRPEIMDLLRQRDIACRRRDDFSIETGIAMVDSRLRAGTLRIFPRCVNLIREAAEYCYAKNSDGRLLNRPIDASNHAMDALRYCVTGMDGRDGAPADRVPEISPDVDIEVSHRLGHDTHESEKRDETTRRADRERFADVWGGAEE